MIGRTLNFADLADRAHGVVAVHLRHHDVHQHDVDVRRRCRASRSPPGRSRRRSPASCGARARSSCAKMLRMSSSTISTFLPASTASVSWSCSIALPVLRRQARDRPVQEQRGLVEQPLGRPHATRGSACRQSRSRRSCSVAERAVARSRRRPECGELGALPEHLGARLRSRAASCRGPDRAPRSRSACASSGVQRLRRPRARRRMDRAAVRAASTHLRRARSSSAADEQQRRARGRSTSALGVSRTTSSSASRVLTGLLQRRRARPVAERARGRRPRSRSRRPGCGACPGRS